MTNTKNQINLKIIDIIIYCVLGLFFVISLNFAITQKIDSSFKDEHKRIVKFENQPLFNGCKQKPTGEIICQ
jgi:hypothetical protein